MLVRKLCANDYDELLSLLNQVFARQNKRETDFVKDLPKMWVKDDEHMLKHIGAFEDGRLVSVVGIYSLPLRVLDETLSFYTVGNVATHWEHTGKGYMSLLLNNAMNELKELGADGSRLSGLRERYNHYGYEAAGQLYEFTFTEHNRASFSKMCEKVEFIKITANDKSDVLYTDSIRTKLPSYVIRKKEDIYPSLAAWQNDVYIIKRSNERIGYMCLGGSTISELGLEREGDLLSVLCSLRELTESDVVFRCFPYELERIRIGYKYAESNALISPSHFKIINFEKVANALMRLRNTYNPFNKGEACMNIEGYGGIRLYANGETCGAESYVGNCDISVDRLTATRLLFGYTQPIYQCEKAEKFMDFCPLPLTWNLQDRV